ncbi:hypothetical protein CUJ89_03785 [Burkholderia pyrrocinia]|uniref:Uncharacterized protein n=1 Tax=Burkholderia pyrrocinia TaxID=60550 RepID=A0A2Z5MRA6_BURPY|nr:hypothetical protein CUJ89_03785 [Burkholderia pyrrocinia]
MAARDARADRRRLRRAGLDGPRARRTRTRARRPHTGLSGPPAARVSRAGAPPGATWPGLVWAAAALLYLLVPPLLAGARPAGAPRPSA